VSGLTPAVIEIVLRAYLLRHYATHGNVPRTPAERAKERMMLLAGAGRIAGKSADPAHPAAQSPHVMPTTPPVAA